MIISKSTDEILLNVSTRTEEVKSTERQQQQQEQQASTHHIQFSIGRTSFSNEITSSSLDLEVQEREKNVVFPF